MKASKLAMGAIIGAAVGVLAGVLTAPKSGRETREDIRRKAGEAKDKAATKRDDLLYKAEEIGDDVRAKATEAIDNVKTSLKK
jgi:gas vesicle protein